MKLIIFILFFLNIVFATASAGEIYQWLDIEGIKQFSNKPPPVGCKTPSCIKLQKKIRRDHQRIKALEKARIEASILEQEESDKQLAAEQRELIKLSPSPTQQSSKTFLAVSTVLCASFNNIREYKNVEQARKYLEREQDCSRTIEEIEYTIIEKQDKFSSIRIYLSRGRSHQKWVETSHLIIDN
ncbi:MAG: hypothetical protein QM479_09380 [Pseudomonadota bacterium]